MSRCSPGRISLWNIFVVPTLKTPCLLHNLTSWVTGWCYGLRVRHSRRVTCIIHQKVCVRRQRASSGNSLNAFQGAASQCSAAKPLQVFGDLRHCRETFRVKCDGCASNMIYSTDAYLTVFRFSEHKVFQNVDYKDAVKDRTHGARLQRRITVWGRSLGLCADLGDAGCYSCSRWGSPQLSSKQLTATRWTMCSFALTKFSSSIKCWMLVFNSK